MGGVPADGGKINLESLAAKVYDHKIEKLKSALEVGALTQEQCVLAARERRQPPPRAPRAAARRRASPR